MFWWNIISHIIKFYIYIYFICFRFQCVLNLRTNFGLWCLIIFKLYRCGHWLLVEETGVPEENHRPIEQVTEKLYHIKLYRVQLTTLVLIGTDYTGSRISNYHTITTTTMCSDWKMKHMQVIVPSWHLIRCGSNFLFSVRIKTLSLYNSQ